MSTVFALDELGVFARAWVVCTLPRARALYTRGASGGVASKFGRARARAPPTFNLLPTPSAYAVMMELRLLFYLNTS